VTAWKTAVRSSGDRHGAIMQVQTGDPPDRRFFLVLRWRVGSKIGIDFRK